MGFFNSGRAWGFLQNAIYIEVVLCKLKEFPACFLKYLQWWSRIFVLLSHLANGTTFVSASCVDAKCLPSVPLENSQNKLLGDFFYSFADTQTLLPVLQPATDCLLGIP